MKRWRIALIVGIGLLLIGLGIYNTTSYNTFHHDSLDDLEWCDRCNPIVFVDADQAIETEKEAAALFFELIGTHYSALTRMTNNNIHIYFDEVDQRFYFHYRGTRFFYFEHEMHAYVDKGSTSMYFIIGI